MIGYVTLGTNDRDRAAAFYDPLLAELGMARMMETEQFIAYGRAGLTGLGITRPFDGAPATVGNGVMVALTAPNRQEVDRLHALALTLGGTDDGAPGERFPGFYAGYVRDPDGNKLNLSVMEGPGAG